MNENHTTTLLKVLVSLTINWYKLRQLNIHIIQFIHMKLMYIIHE